MASNGDFVDMILHSIKMQSKETYTDPMWFIIALKLRNEGKTWKECKMENYAVNKEGDPIIKPVTEKWTDKITESIDLDIYECHCGYDDIMDKICPHN